MNDTDRIRLDRLATFNIAILLVQMSENPVADDRPLASASSIQLRVLASLVRRQVRANTAETRLGYLWALVEPSAHLAMYILLFTVIMRRYNPLGGSLTVFLLTGLVPWFLYFKLSGQVMAAMPSNRALLGLPPVKPLDILLCGGIVEAATYLMVAFIMFSVARLIGFEGAIPCRPLMLTSAIVMIFGFGLGIGLINAMIAVYFPLWRAIYSLIFGPLYFFSGIWFLIDDTPPPYRDYLLYNPILQLITWFRLGFYADYRTTYFYPMYAVWWMIAMLLIGLLLERVMRPKLLAA